MIAARRGDSYRDVDGTELIAYLERSGVSFEGAGLHNLMHRLALPAAASDSGGLAAVGCKSRGWDLFGLMTADGRRL